MGPVCTEAAAPVRPESDECRDDRCPAGFGEVTRKGRFGHRRTSPGSAGRILLGVIVVTRFEVAEADSVAFVAQAETAIAVLRRRDGLRSLDFGRNLDEPTLWTITSRWDDVGSYRRALSGIESRSVVVPLLSRAIDEPTAYEDPDLVGPNLARGSVPPR